MAWTFTTLKQSIQDYTNNTETTFVNNLDEFIVEAEEAIIKLVDLPYFRKSVTGQLTSDNQYLTMPTDFLAPYSLAIDNSGYEYLLFKDVSFMREAYPSSSTTGIPKYYAMFNNESFIVAPTPSSNLTAELHYRYKPTSITVTSDGTTWIGTNASDCLLYGSLVEACTYLKNYEIIPAYESKFVEALVSLKNLGETQLTSTRDQTRYDEIRREPQA